MKSKLLILILLFFSFFVSVNAKEIDLHIFYGEGCPHCKEEFKFLDELKKEYKELKIYKYEVWYDESSNKIFKDVQNMLGKNASGIPYTIIGNQVITGFRKEYKSRIKAILDYYKDNNYRDLVNEMLGNKPIRDDIVLEDIEIKANVFSVPILGEIDPRGTSLLFLAAIIGFVDGFNPCAMWILLFLISMLMGMKDKRRMWILGLTFLLTSAFIYFMFMVAWLNLAVVITKILYIRILISLFAIVFGTINIWKYIISNKDGCEIVSDNKRKKIIEKIKSIISEKRFGLAIIGIILLAVSVNVIELLCSAGLPLMYTNILAINNLNPISYYIYIIIYVLFFLIDDIIVFSVAMFTLKQTGISTKYTKYSHLIGGVIILIIGILLLFRPEILMFNF